MAAAAVSRRSSSWRSSAASRTGRSAASGASPGPGTTSPTTPTTATRSPRISPAFSIPITPLAPSTATSLSGSRRPDRPRSPALGSFHVAPAPCPSTAATASSSAATAAGPVDVTMSATRPLANSPFSQSRRLGSRRWPWLPSSLTAPRLDSIYFARTEPVQRVFIGSDFEESDDDDAPSDTDGDGGYGGSEFWNLYEATNFCVQGLEVFSSVTGKWVQSHACRDSRVRLVEGMGSVFINGFVNLLTHEKKVLAVDPEGRAWRLIPLPVSSRFGLDGCLGQSQGFLHYAVQEGCGSTMMQVWFLKDFEKGDWILKHRFEIEVAPQTKILFDYAGNGFWSEIFYVVVFHPSRDLVFVPVEGYKLLSYNLINDEVKEICMLEPETRPRFLVYVPSYVDLPNPDVQVKELF